MIIRNVRPRVCRGLHTFRESYGLWINGAEVPSASGATFAMENPATLEHLTHVAEGRAEDVDAALAAAKAAFESGEWSRAEAGDRANVLNKAAALLRARVPEFAALESLQTGRALREMNTQLGRLPEWLEYFGALIRVDEGSVPPFKGPYVNYVTRMPLGVVGQITPWNHPMLIAIKKIAPALATGNSIVVKPSELAPVTLIEFAAIMREAGLPDGVLNVVPGYGPTAGAALAGDPRIKLLDVTGGTPMGRIVAAEAGKNLCGVVSELGGKAPMIVFPDADLDAVVNGCAFGSFIATGQTCIAGTRLLVHEDVFEEVVARYIAKVETIKIAHPQEAECQLGPVISAAQLARVEEFVALAKEEGARVLTGGKRPVLDDPRLTGHFYEPTVIGDVTREMRVVQEEVFGPVVVAYSFKDEAEAIELANDSPFGLAAAVWTKDIKKAHRVAEHLDVGIIWLNDHHRNDPSSPWGGTKDSGLGRENGVEALREYTQTKSVVVGYDDAPFDWFADPNARYG